MKCAGQAFSDTVDLATRLVVVVVGKKSILVVDDDRTILTSLAELLRLEGYDVDVAETGSEAMKKADARYYNLALLDIKLPDMDGTELLDKMRETVPKMVKIMVTGYPELGNAVKSLNMGANAYLLKPVDPKTLLEMVQKKLQDQDEAERMSQEKVKEWIETRVRKLKHGEG